MNYVMKINKKKAISIFILMLFLVSTIGLAADIFMRRSNKNPNMSGIVIIETNKGNIEIELNGEKAPITVENFVNYVNEGFYDGLCFHRVKPGFVIQGGGFYPNGEYNPPNNPIKIESDNGLKNLKGTIAMARSSEPDSATSQFYINTVDNPDLDYPSFDGYGYTVFGEVIAGMDVVEQIEAIQTGIKETPYGSMADWPTDPVEIIRAYMKDE
jgi:cyclophilin family peptidyl-prolyl cis-trans isomerase